MKNPFSLLELTFAFFMKAGLDDNKDYISGHIDVDFFFSTTQPLPSFFMHTTVLTTFGEEMAFF